MRPSAAVAARSSCIFRASSATFRYGLVTRFSDAGTAPLARRRVSTLRSIRPSAEKPAISSCERDQPCVRRYRARANATRAEINGKDPLPASPSAEQEVEVVRSSQRPCGASGHDSRSLTDPPNRRSGPACRRVLQIPKLIVRKAIVPPAGTSGSGMDAAALLRLPGGWRARPGVRGMHMPRSRAFGARASRTGLVRPAMHDGKER